MTLTTVSDTGLAAVLVPNNAGDEVCVPAMWVTKSVSRECG